MNPQPSRLAFERLRSGNAVPELVYDAEPGYAAFQAFAWESAAAHIFELEGMPNSPYMDEGFCDCSLWIWDSCFMMFFCRYAPAFFPGPGTLDNFYRVLYDGVPLPRIGAERVPWWLQFAIEPDHRIRMNINLFDNPPLFAWAELEYARFTGDRRHVRALLEKGYLQKHFRFLETLREPDFRHPFVRLPTCWRARPDGYFWEGGCSGMDNTPRGRIGRRADRERPARPGLLWVDAISQQALSARCIAELAGLIDEAGLEAEWRAVHREICERINRVYWDEQDGFYYDVDEATGEFVRVVTPASLWPLLAGAASPEQARAVCEKVIDPEKLGGTPPLVTLARNDPDFVPENGDYWRGGFWMPTAYMGIRALEFCGMHECARELSGRMVEHMYRVWREYDPPAIWEAYAPCSPEPARHHGKLVRPGYCGWSALGPTALLLEEVVGIDADAFSRRLRWRLPPRRKGRVGVRNYRFADVTADLIAETDRVAVSTDRPFLLEIDGREFRVEPGESSLPISGEAAIDLSEKE